MSAASADRALAARINLVLDDFPGGWRQLPTTANPDEEVSDCLRSARSGLTITGDVTSERFAKGPIRIAASNTTVFATPEQAESAFERTLAADLGQCVAHELMAAASPEDQVRLLEASAGEITFPSLGERSVAYQVMGTVRVEDVTAKFFVDLVLVRRDRTLVVLIAGDAPAPFPSKLEQKLARILEARMEPAVDTSAL